MLFPEYQCNDIESGLFIFLMCPIWCSNSPDFNRPFIPVDIRDCLRRAPLRRPTKTIESSKQDLASSLLPSNYQTCTCSCILFSWQCRIPLNRLLIPGGRLSHSPRGYQVLKGAPIIANVVRNFSTFLGYLKGSFF